MRWLVSCYCCSFAYTKVFLLAMTLDRGQGRWSVWVWWGSNDLSDNLPSPLGSSFILWGFCISCGSKRLRLAMCTHALWADWKPWFEKAIYCLKKAKRVTFDLLCSCIDVVRLWMWICKIAFWAVSWWSVALSTWNCWACSMMEKLLFWCV